MVFERKRKRNMVLKMTSRLSLSNWEEGAAINQARGRRGEERDSRES